MPLSFLLLSTCQANDQFNDAQILFKNKEYQKAAELYQAFEPKNDALWYNLGHCYAQQDDYYQALICWRKAQKNAYGKRFLHLQDLIQLAEQKLGVFRQSQIQNITYQLKKYSLAISVVIWQVSFLFLWYLVLYLLLKRKRCKKIVSVLLLFFLSFVGGGLMIHYDKTTSLYAIVNDNNVPVYVGTDERFSQKMVISKGQCVMIKQTDTSWRKIECAAGSGWICANKLEELA